MPNVAIAIPTSNSAPKLGRCLMSISRLEFDKQSLEVVVVDDASLDKTDEAVEAAFKEMKRLGFGRLEYRRLEQQRGAPAALNEALRVISGNAEFVWKLDSDTEPLPESLKNLVDFLSAPGNGNIGACVSSIRRPTGEEEPVLCAFLSRPRLWTKTLAYFTFQAYSAQRDGAVVGLHGASLLLRASALQKTGEFDERFFLYYDDTDLCLRMTRAGYRLAAVPTSKVIHSKVDRLGTKMLPALYYLLRNPLLFARKHLSIPDFICLCLAQPFVFPWRFSRLCSQYRLWSFKGVLWFLRVWSLAWYDFVFSRYERRPSEVLNSDRI